jgi:hypothetical protein
MSEYIELKNSLEIRDWVNSNSYDIVSIDSEAPRFFQPRFMVTPGQMQIFGVQHTFLKDDKNPLVSLQRSFRATSAEDALRQYLQESKERSFGGGEERVGFKLFIKAGSWDYETINVFKETEE